MFDDENVFEWCIENGVSVTQYLFMFFLMEKGFEDPSSRARRYIKKFGIFNREEVDDLIERGYVEDFNSKGKNHPEFYIVRDEVVKLMKATTSQAEELWSTYPATFELPGNVNFIARHAGVLGDKENTLETYLRKIKRSKKKHKFVIEMLKKYLKLVESNKMNSMKLGDWIANDVWNIINEVKEEDNDYGIEFK